VNSSLDLSGSGSKLESNGTVGDSGFEGGDGLEGEGRKEGESANGEGSEETRRTRKSRHAKRRKTHSNSRILQRVLKSSVKVRQELLHRSLVLDVSGNTLSDLDGVGFGEVPRGSGVLVSSGSALDGSLADGGFGVLHSLL